MITLAELKEILEIDETSPSWLRWKVNRYNIKVGDKAGSLESKNYYTVTINQKRYKNHRVIYALFNNLELNQLPEFLDHIDRNPSNNNPLNLRPTTRSQNAINVKLNSKNTSGIKGVHWFERDKKWQSQIVINNKYKFLGRFDTIEEAAEAYKEASIKYHGDFSSFN